MAAPKAPVLGGKNAKDVSLDEAVFGVELKPHLVHEAVRAEANSHRQGTGEEPTATLADQHDGTAAVCGVPAHRLLQAVHRPDYRCPDVR